MDTADAYQQTREQIIALAGAADASTPVPACPEWSVRELLAHLAGVAGDVLAGNIADAGTEHWVAAQLEARSGRSAGELIEEWSESGPAVDEVCRALGDAAAQLIFDTVTHEQDLRGALDTPGAGAGAIDVALRWAAPTWAANDAPTHGSLRLHAGEIEVTRGAGAPECSLTLEPLEALRALTGRRSLDQVRAYDWTGDAEAWLPAFTWGPFVPRPDALAG
jgi:uncharacterized protein (TIGR03083 family)